MGDRSLGAAASPRRASRSVWQLRRPRLGEDVGQGIDRSEAFRIMDVACDLGLTPFDTTDAYGGGRSEETIGAWLKTKASTSERG